MQMLRKNQNTGQDELTEEGHSFLSAFVTDTRGPIYALKETLPMAVAAAAMARLSRCADDLRVIILKEFMPLQPPVEQNVGREAGLLRRVITAYGDDSVQQLAGLYVVIQSPSNLLTKLLERPRIGTAYLEQSTRYIFFDQKVQAPTDAEPHFRYIVPPELSPEDAVLYRKHMDQQFERYSSVVRQLSDYLVKNSSEPEEKRDLAWRNAIRAQACDAARGMLPAATTSTVGIFASAQALDSLIMHLLGHPLQEARDTGSALLREVRKVAPVFFERTDLPERGGATTAYLSQTRERLAEFVQARTNQLIQTLTSQRMTTDRPFDPHCSGLREVQLVDYYPKEEKELTNALLFPYGARRHYFSISPDSRVEEVDLTDEQFAELVRAYAGDRLNRRHHPGRMFEEPLYTFEFRTSYGEFRDLQRHRLVDAFEWQLLDPSQFEYEVPALILEAGLRDLHRESFMYSAQMWSTLRGYGNPLAQYAVLFGFKMNWRWTLNLREAMHIIELRTTPQGHPAYRRVCQKMYEEIKRVHPTLASTISFVNCGEDPELTRLAAERATAFKLSLQPQ